MNNLQIINALLRHIFANDLDIRKWLSGYNRAFDMSPDEMIKQGREEEVVGYLINYVYGPF